MPEFEIKKVLNQHLRIRSDPSNAANLKNIDVFDSVLMGYSETPQFSYLINLGSARAKDGRSIAAFNDANVASHANAHERHGEIEDGKTVYLEQRGRLPMPLGECLEKRRSTRRFSRAPLEFKALSTLCKYSFGHSKRKETYGGIEVKCRYHASGGGFYPLKEFLYVKNAQSVTEGLYAYQPASHSLYPTGRNFSPSQFLLGSGFDLENFSLLAIYEYEVNKNYLKYGELSLLTALAEVGTISHNFELCATALGCGACQIAGFDKNYAEKALDLDGLNSHVVFANICGKRRRP